MLSIGTSRQRYPFISNAIYYVFTYISLSFIVEGQQNESQKVITKGNSGLQEIEEFILSSFTYVPNFGIRLASNNF